MENTVEQATLIREALSSARQLLDKAVIDYRGRPVGTAAADGTHGLTADNYHECFVRDFAVSAFTFLADRKPEIVGNFLETVLGLCEREPAERGHEIQPGIMPASFRVVRGEDDEPHLTADFGDRAIGRVAPVDAMMWWLVILHAYTQVTGDRSLAERDDLRNAVRLVVRLCLTSSFEVFPTLLVPDGAFMIDRRLGVYGHPLEIQALFYAMLHTVGELYGNDAVEFPLVQRAAQRQLLLRDYVRERYWLDGARLSEINRLPTERFGADSDNMLNIHPESISTWLEPWLPEQGGFLAGNVGSGRLDVRFFALGNLLAIIFGLASEDQAQAIMDLYEARWDDLVGNVPLKICYPALEGTEWRLMTGCDPKNVPWSYHNAGTWPVLLWPFVAAALITRRREIAERAVGLVAAKVASDGWPEYYDGRYGRLMGRRANIGQVWSAAGFILAQQLLDDPTLLAMFPGQPSLNPV